MAEPSAARPALKSRKPTPPRRRTGAPCRADRRWRRPCRLACKNTKLRAFRPVGTLLPKEVLEIGYGLCQSFSKLGFGFPLKGRLRHRDVWLLLSRVIRRQRLKTNLGLCPGHFDDEFG